eukprot:1598102-Prymnesium_polylepis.1
MVEGYGAGAVSRRGVSRQRVRNGKSRDGSRKRKKRYHLNVSECGSRQCCCREAHSDTFR